MPQGGARHFEPLPRFCLASRSCVCWDCAVLSQRHRVPETFSSEEPGLGVGAPVPAPLCHNKWAVPGGFLLPAETHPASVKSIEGTG